MAARFRDILNRVLRNVGEPEIFSGDTALGLKYNKMLGNFLNTIKNEVESAGRWRVLRTEVPFTVLAGANTAINTSTNERARVIRIADQEAGQFVPLVWDITDTANPVPLIEVDMSMMMYMIRQQSPGYSTTHPTYFAMDSFSTGADEPRARINVFPAPLTNRTIAAFMVVPQARLADNDLDVWIKVPSDLLELGTTWYALMERGEEMGTNGLFTEERYRQALNAAIAMDEAEQGDLELVPV